MTGYVVIDTEVIDAGAYAEFVERVPAAIDAHGGRLLVRISDVEAILGEWAPKRFVIMEFDSLGAARGFVDSDEYGALDEIRRRAPQYRIVVVGG